MSGQYYIPACRFTTVSQEAQMNVVEEFKSSFDTYVPDAGTISLSDAPLVRDMITSISDVLRAPAPWSSGFGSAASQPSYNIGLVVSPDMTPVSSMIVGTQFAGSAGWVGNAPAYAPATQYSCGASCSISIKNSWLGSNPVTTLQFNSMDHFSACFYFYRGGIRLFCEVSRSASDTDTVLVCTPHCAVTTDAEACNPQTVSYPLVSVSLRCDSEYPAGFHKTTTSSDLIEFELPWKANRLFFSTGSLLPAGSTLSTAFTYPDLSPYKSIIAYLELLGGKGNCGGIWRSIADDFRFYCYRPPPPSLLVVNSGPRTAGSDPIGFGAGSVQCVDYTCLHYNVTRSIQLP